MLLLLAVGCVPVDPPRASLHPMRPEATAQRVRAGVSTDGTGMLSLHVLVTDEAGNPAPCGTGELTVTVETSTVSVSGPFTTLDASAVEVRCLGEGAGDVALVVDNSGSEDGYLPPLQRGAQAMVDGVIGSGGRASVVRVSTDASVSQPLTADAGTLGAAIDGLYIHDGWTALWDGMRAGNETLGAAGRTPGSLSEFCDGSGRLGVVTFTDGQDNNSSGEQAYDHDAYPGDGIDTTFDDVLKLRSNGASTPLYTIGLGDEVDGPSLQSLADATGGRYLQVDDPEDVEGVFDLVTDYFAASTQVCAEVPDVECGRMWVRVTAEWSDGTTLLSSTSTSSTTIDCDVPSTGSTALLLLTLTNPGISTDTATALATQSVAFVAPVPDPRVLVVLDDNHHDEYRGDTYAIASLLAAAGYDVTYDEEPEDGIVPADLWGYDVVWYSNPGYPMDEHAGAEALEAFAADGGGLVLQGDDMSWSWGDEFSMASLTHLDHVSNGTSSCGAYTDNNAGSSYRVTFEAVEHDLLGDLAGTSFTYGDDIDESTPRDEGEVVLAWATLDGTTDCPVVPVVVAWAP